MKIDAFFDNVENHPELEGAGIEEGENPAVYIRHRPSQLMTRLPLTVIADVEWPVLEDILVGRREPVVLQHMTRVVGYYSRVENWNKSKIGELRDRQKGDYAIRHAG